VGWLPIAFAGLLLGWIVYETSFMRRMKPLLYPDDPAPAPPPRQDPAAHPGGDGGAARPGRWVERSQGGATVRFFLPAAHLPPSAGLTWEQKMRILKRHEVVSLVWGLLVVAVFAGATVLGYREFQEANTAELGPVAQTVTSPRPGAPRAQIFETVFLGRIAVIIAEQDGVVLVRQNLGRVGGWFLLTPSTGLIWRHTFTTPDIPAAALRRLDSGNHQVIVMKPAWRGPGVFVFTISPSGAVIEEATLDAVPAGVSFPNPPRSPTAALFSERREFANGTRTFAARVETRFSLVGVVPRVRLTIWQLQTSP
jgi:hypothetical protein